MNRETTEPTMVGAAGPIAHRLHMPPSVNRVYLRANTGRVVKTEAARQYGIVAGATLARAGSVPIDGPVDLYVEVHRNRESGDLDNRLKVLLDAMQGYLYRNDEQVARLTVARFRTEAYPYVVVRATPAAGNAPYAGPIRTNDHLFPRADPAAIPRPKPKRPQTDGAQPVPTRKHRKAGGNT